MVLLTDDVPVLLLFYFAPSRLSLCGLRAPVSEWRLLIESLPAGRSEKIKSDTPKGRRQSLLLLCLVVAVGR